MPNKELEQRDFYANPKNYTRFCYQPHSALRIQVIQNEGDELFCDFDTKIEFLCDDEDILLEIIDFFREKQEKFGCSRNHLSAIHDDDM